MWLQKAAPWLCFVLVFLPLQFYGAAELSGFHFDEAWAANFALRIAEEPWFWPLHAMSPYTAPWMHYFTALCFKLFGANIAVFRASNGILLSVGVLLLQASLLRFKLPFAACGVALGFATLPALFLNHRFAIELTQFHVFCLGILALAASHLCSRRIFRFPRRSPIFWVLGFNVVCFLGVTAHAQFLALLFAGLTWVLFFRRRLNLVERGSLAVLSAVFALFFTQVYFQIPEKEKALGLLFVFGFLMAWSLLSGRVPKWIFRRRRVLQVLVVGLALPAVGMGLFFWDGSWSTLVMRGELVFPWFAGFNALAFVIFALVLFKQKRVSPHLGFLLLGTLLWTHAMMIKAAPRYFELAFVLALLWLLIEIERMGNRLLKKAFLVLCAFNLMLLFVNFIQPASRQGARLSEFRFLIFTDASQDFLSKQRWVKQRAAEGCGPDRVRSANPRILEALRFLERGDWTVEPTQKCPFELIPVGLSNLDQI